MLLKDNHHTGNLALSDLLQFEDGLRALDEDLGVAKGAITRNVLMPKDGLNRFTRAAFPIVRPSVRTDDLIAKIKLPAKGMDQGF